ncbi:hypothetical protein GCM10007036_12600 [Alsobacter metallidurans]|uniref:ChbG/HpnK family deacetylase n=1 Tax=Alsobacter metallidurans TaxID=340221 RepID=A0A917I5N3_9HYPH|nr:ChbG/HpnK family deacetylase [Alsobacter metallidurans]GGH13760.1 hypothetical protein GCM10007036_12600 [Alsobacter metallidurans]
MDLCYPTAMSSYRSSARPSAFALVADDYALTDGVSRAILELATAGRISGTGAMTNRPAWPEAAKALREHEGRIDMGLHLNMTLGRPLGPMRRLCGSDSLPAFNQLATLAFSARLDGVEIRDEILRQIDAFALHYGRLPDYIDGHQHVHVLPGVRGALLDAVALRWAGEPKPVLRDPFDTPGAILARGVAPVKATVIAALAIGWGRRLDRAGLPHNQGFSGVSAFDPKRDYAIDFDRFLQAPGPAHLVMCHPGFPDAELAALDPVTECRAVEHCYLASEDFAVHLANNPFELRRLTQLTAQP